MNKEQIINVIYNVFDEVNEQLDLDARLKKSTDTVIVGDGGKLDSLGMVNFVVGLEQKLMDELDVDISLADQLMNADDHFRTVDSLAAFIAGNPGGQ